MTMARWLETYGPDDSLAQSIVANATGGSTPGVGLEDDADAAAAGGSEPNVSTTESQVPVQV